MVWDVLVLRLYKAEFMDFAFSGSNLVVKLGFLRFC